MDQGTGPFFGGHRSALDNKSLAEIVGINKFGSVRVSKKDNSPICLEIVSLELATAAQGWIAQNGCTDCTCNLHTQINHYVQ